MQIREKIGNILITATSDAEALDMLKIEIPEGNDVGYIFLAQLAIVCQLKFLKQIKAIGDKHAEEFYLSKQSNNTH